MGLTHWSLPTHFDLGFDLAVVSAEEGVSGLNSSGTCGGQGGWAEHTSFIYPMATTATDSSPIGVGASEGECTRGVDVFKPLATSHEIATDSNPIWVRTGGNVCVCVGATQGL